MFMTVSPVLFTNIETLLYSEKKPYPSTNFPTTNHTWTVLDLEPALHVEKQAFGHPSYETANPKYLIRQYA